MLATDTPIRYLDRQHVLSAWYTALGFRDGRRTKKRSDGDIVALSYAVVGLAWSGDPLSVGTLRAVDYDVIEFGYRVADALGDKHTSASIVERAGQLIEKLREAQAPKDTSAFS